MGKRLITQLLSNKAIIKRRGLQPSNIIATMTTENLMQAPHLVKLLHVIVGQLPSTYDCAPFDY